MSVLPLAEAKTYLNITAGTYDGELQGFIGAAEAAIAHRVGPLEPTVVTARIGGAAALVLPVYPVLSLTTIADDGGTSVPTVGLSVDLASGVVSGSTFGSDFYTVTYSAGRNPCPADLRLAVMELVRHMWQTQRGPTARPGSAASDAASNTIPGAAYLFPFRVEQLLLPHTQLGFA